MAITCLPSHLVNVFKKGILSGEIDPVKLSEMSSGDRRVFLAERFGEDNAAFMNKSLESKLLLQNQQAGMISWANTMLKGKPEIQRDIVGRVQRLGKLLSPEDEKHFLGELVSARIGATVTYPEAQRITELSANIDTTRAARDAGGDRLPYGHAVTELKKYVGGLISKEKGLTFAQFKQRPVRTTLEAISSASGVSKSIIASLDLSALFRQGFKTFMTSPDIWKTNSLKSFGDVVKAYGSDAVMDAVHADIYSRPTYPLMRKAKLAVGMNEERLPSNWPEKIPFFGKIYRATEHPYTAFIQKTRADVFDRYIEIAQSVEKRPWYGKFKEGTTELDQKQLESIGKVVNSLLGRANLGSLEKAADVANNVFFSPRFVKSQVDVLTAHATDDITPFARKQAAVNLVKIVTGTATILATAHALGGRVYLNPEDKRYGQVCVGNLCYDVSGGAHTVTTLAARMIHQAAYTAGFARKPKTAGAQAIENFLTNRLSPAAAAGYDVMKGRTYEGKRPTFMYEAKKSVEPFVIRDLEEFSKTNDAAGTLAGTILDGLGVTVTQEHH